MKKTKLPTLTMKPRRGLLVPAEDFISNPGNDDAGVKAAVAAGKPAPALYPTPVEKKRPQTTESCKPSPEHWLRILPDGTERKFVEEPTDIPTLHVWTANDREFTATFDRAYFCDGCLTDVR